jgi:hypothetical protein
MTNCLICEHSLSISKLSCSACKTNFEGDFSFSRLARLNKTDQKLAESLILSGGNLKDLAETLDLSYPTLKKRLLSLTQNLKDLKELDDKKIEKILEDIQDEKIKAEEGIKLIKEINNEL